MTALAFESTSASSSHASRSAGHSVPVSLPTARRPDVTLASQTYDDVNLVPVKGSSVVVGQAAGLPPVPPSNPWIWVAIGGGW